MREITHGYIESISPNRAAFQRGRGLVAKGKFQNLYISEDGSLLFGICKGSGKKSYTPSVDFIREENPTFRCSCPSRQFPCKHSIGILYAYFSDMAFETADIPDDILQKRTKLKKRSTKGPKINAPRKVNEAALRKKLETQIEGLSILEALVKDTLKRGLGNVTVTVLSEMERQTERLGNMYLAGAQSALLELIYLYKINLSDDEASNSAYHRRAIALLNRLWTGCKKGERYLRERLEAEGEVPLVESEIATWLGHIWKLDELEKMGCVKEDAHLLQLSFFSRDIPWRKEYCDEGVWIDMESGELYKTQNYRPYRATKHVKQEDSCFELLFAPKLYIYPGKWSPRVRWKEFTLSSPHENVCDSLRGHASSDLRHYLKSVKGEMKSPTGTRSPLGFIWFDSIGTIDDALHLKGQDGTFLRLGDDSWGDEPSTTETLQFLDGEHLQNNCMLGRVVFDHEEENYFFMALTIVTPQRIIRLSY